MARSRSKRKDTEENTENESVVTEKDPLSFGDTSNASKNKSARIEINENQLASNEDLAFGFAEEEYETSSTSLSSRHIGDPSTRSSTATTLSRSNDPSSRSSTATSLSRYNDPSTSSNDTSFRMRGDPSIRSTTDNSFRMTGDPTTRSTTATSFRTSGDTSNTGSGDETTVGEFEIVPYDGLHKLPATYRQTTTDELMNINAKSKKTYILLQLLRIVSGSTDPHSNKGSSNYSYYNRNQQNQSMKGSYSRMFLFREISSRVGQVLYMIESRTSNEKLWGRQPEFRDNGVLTVGRCIAVICPTPIQNMLKDEALSIPPMWIHTTYTVPKKIWRAT